MIEIDPAMLVAAEQDVVWCELGSGSTLLNLNSNIYYRLNEVGTYIWGAIADPVTFGDLCRRTEEEFDAKPEQVSEDLADLIVRLDEANLVRCSRK
jgi:hypothetical protein